MSTPALHPAVAPVIDALQRLGDYQPGSPAELADVLRFVHDLTNPVNVLEILGDALIALGQRAEHDAIAAHLEDAAGALAGAAEDIDRARCLTGHWHGSAAPVAT